MGNNEFEHIANRIRAAALNAALSSGACDDDAEDIAQDITLKLWMLRSDISSDVHAVRLAAVSARNLTISRHRQRRTVDIDGKETIADNHTSAPDARLVEDEDTAWIMAKMRLLPPKEYEILRLRQVEQKSNGDIALLLGIDKASVATMLSRARTKLLNDIKRRMKR